MAQSASTVWQAFQFKNTPIPWRRLWGTALTTSLGLAIGLILGHLEWGIMAFMGGFASLYVQNQPYRTRGLTLLFVGLGLAASMALGALSSLWWAMALALGFVSLASTYLTGAFDIPLPAGFMFVLIACISAALPLHPPGVLITRVEWVLIGAAIAWLVGMSDWLWKRRAPVQAPIAAAYRALSHYVRHIGTPSASQAQYQAALAMSTAHKAVLADQGADPHARDLAAEAETILRSAVALSSSESHPLPHTWGRLLEDMAHHIDGTHYAPLDTPNIIKRGHLWIRWHDTMADAVRLITLKTPHHALPKIHEASTQERLARALTPDSLVFFATLRIGIAVALSVVTAHLLGIAHPFWIPLTCAAVLQGVSTAVITQRTIQRAVGTTLGLILTGALLTLHPGSIATAALVVALQLLMLFFIAKNYGISVVFITTLALVIIYSGTHPAIMPMVKARFIDTLLGGAIGLISAFFLWGRASSARLPDAMAQALEATGQLFQSLLRGVPQHLISHRRAYAISRLLSVHLLYDTALSELPKSHVRDQDWSAILSVERIGYLVIALCDNLRPQNPKLAKALAPVFASLAEGLRNNSDHPLPRIPSMSRYHAIEQELWDLADLLGLSKKQSSKTS